MVDWRRMFFTLQGKPRVRAACAKAAYDRRAELVVLRPMAGTMPHEVGPSVATVVKHIPGGHVGIHAITTARAGGSPIRSRRCARRAADPGRRSTARVTLGNANLCSLIPTLRLEERILDAFEIGVTEKHGTE